jgi:thioredoxin reductase (NADPH)
MLLAAVAVTAIRREGPYIVVETDQGDSYCGHVALIATGSSYRRLGVPGEEELIGAGIHFCATCDGPFYRGAEELLVIGGGNSGLEEGLLLSQFAERIRLVEFMPELKASAILQEKVISDPRFTVHVNTQVTAFERSEGGKLAGVRAVDRATGEEQVFEPAAAFVFVGLDPNTAFLNGALETDDMGFITTAENLETSMPGVFAAGDVRATSTKQLGAATGEGITALIHIRQYLERLGDVPVHETA